MNAELYNTRAYVSLSRRNLETLIKMLDQKTGIASLSRRTESGITVLVQAEENAEHYQGRTPGFGPEDVDA